MNYQEYLNFGPLFYKMGVAAYKRAPVRTKDTSVSWSIKGSQKLTALYFFTDIKENMCLLLCLTVIFGGEIGGKRRKETFSALYFWVLSHYCKVICRNSCILASTEPSAPPEWRPGAQSPSEHAEPLMTVDSARPQLHNHAAQIPILWVKGAAPVALKREGTTTEHVFKIHIGSASQGVLMLMVEERYIRLI